MSEKGHMQTSFDQIVGAGEYCRKHGEATNDVRSRLTNRQRTATALRQF
jgi:hypothetical protein